MNHQNFPIVGLQILWSVVPFLVGRLVRYWSFWPLIQLSIHFRGQVMITWHQSFWVLLYQCHPTFMVNENEKAMNGSKRQNYGNRDTISHNLSRSDYFFHHIVLVLSHMESNQIPFFLVSSGANQVLPEVRPSHRLLGRCPHGLKYGYMAVLSQKCRLIRLIQSQISTKC